MQHFLTFKDVAEAMRSLDARLQEHLPYFNTNWKEGTTIGFSVFPAWFEVNIHDAKSMIWEDALSLLMSSPNTELNNSETKHDGNRCWFGGDGLVPITFGSGTTLERFELLNTGQKLCFPVACEKLAPYVFTAEPTNRQLSLPL